MFTFVIQKKRVQVFRRNGSCGRRDRASSLCVFLFCVMVWLGALLLVVAWAARADAVVTTLCGSIRSSLYCSSWCLFFPTWCCCESSDMFHTTRIADRLSEKVQRGTANVRRACSIVKLWRYLDWEGYFKSRTFAGFGFQYDVTIVFFDDLFGN